MRNPVNLWVMLGFKAVLLLSAIPIHAEIRIAGTVVNTSSSPIADVVVRLLRNGLADTTNADGKFLLSELGSVVRGGRRIPLENNVAIANGRLSLTLHNKQPVNIVVFNTRGSLLKRIKNGHCEAGVHNFDLPQSGIGAGILLVRVSYGDRKTIFRYCSTKLRAEGVTASANGALLLGKQAATVVDSLLFSRPGFVTASIALTSLIDTAIAVTMDSATANGSVSGTLFAPAGQSVEGSEVMACVPTATGECDTTKSIVISISTSGASAPFHFDNLPPDNYYLIGAKDLNANGTLDYGDYLGGHLDEAGNWVPVTPPFSGATVRMVVVPSTQTAVPTELIGTWGQPGYQYTIYADGTYDYVLIWMSSGSCVIYWRTDFTRAGSIAVSGDQLTFVPSQGTSTYQRCNGDIISSLATPTPSAFTYRIALDNGVPTLYLTDINGERGYPKQ